MPQPRVKQASSLSRRQFVAVSGAMLTMPAVLRQTRAFAQEPVFKVGYSSALTGPHAATAEPDPFVLGEMKAILGGGVDNNGKRVRIEILDRDTESVYAARIAEDLVFGEGVDLIAATSVPDNVIPVADVAEVNGVPCISTDAPWQPFFFGRSGDPAVGFDWTFHFNWGVEDIIASFVALWKAAGVGKTVGGVFPDSPDARIWTDPRIGFPPELEKAGFTWVQPPFYGNTFSIAAGDPLPQNGFLEQIKVLKDANCEIVTGNMSAPEIAQFRGQAAALDYQPKIATIARGLIYPSYLELLGDHAHRMTTEVWWSPSFPYRSSLTGQSAQELADAYTRATGRPWTMPLGKKHALFEVIADVVKRTADLDDPAAIVDAIATTKLDTVVGPIAWTGDPVKNVTKTPLVAGQWQKEADDFKLVIVDNTTHPQIPVGRPLQLLQ